MWKDLSISKKSDIIRKAVDSGVTNLSDIRDSYNSFAEGGSMGYPEWKRDIAEKKGLDIDNDTSYNYREFYDENPEMAEAMLRGFRDAHFTDRYKDGNGNPTIGYGFTEKYLKEHNLLDMFPPVEKDLPTAYEPAKENQQRIDRESCDGIFESMVDDYSERAKKIDGFNNLDRSQRDALVSYFYNAGFNQPKLKKAIEECRYKDAKKQIDAGMTQSEGLKKRREEEQSIWDGTYFTAQQQGNPVPPTGASSDYMHSPQEFGPITQHPSPELNNSRPKIPYVEEKPELQSEAHVLNENSLLSLLQQRNKEYMDSVYGSYNDMGNPKNLIFGEGTDDLETKKTEDTEPVYINNTPIDGAVIEARMPRLSFKELAKRNTDRVRRGEMQLSQVPYRYDGKYMRQYVEGNLFGDKVAQESNKALEEEILPIFGLAATPLIAINAPILLANPLIKGFVKAKLIEAGLDIAFDKIPIDKGIQWLSDNYNKLPDNVRKVTDSILGGLNTVAGYAEPVVDTIDTTFDYLDQTFGDDIKNVLPKKLRFIPDAINGANISIDTIQALYALTQGNTEGVKDGTQDILDNMVARQKAIQNAVKYSDGIIDLLKPKNKDEDNLQ